MGDAKRRRAQLGDEAYFSGDPAWNWRLGRPTALPKAADWIAEHTAYCKGQQSGGPVSAGYDDQTHGTLDTSRGPGRGKVTSKRGITCRACGARARVQVSD